MDELIEDKRDTEFLSNDTKNAIYQASLAIKEELDQLILRGFSVLDSHIPSDESIIVDTDSLNVKFMTSDYLDALEDASGISYGRVRINQEDSISVLISLYLIQETDISISYKDCPNPKLVEKLDSSGFLFHPMKRNASLSEGFFREKYNSVFVTYLPLDYEDKLSKSIRRRLKENTDIELDRELSKELLNFPNTHNKFWQRHHFDSEDGFNAHTFVRTAVHEYVHLLHAKISSGSPPEWLKEGFAWFVGIEIGEKFNIEDEIENASKGYNNPAKIVWTVNFLREKYNSEKPSEPLLKWVQEIMIDIEESDIELDAHSFIKIALPDDLSLKLGELHDIFDEEFISTYEELHSNFKDFEYYCSRKNQEYESRINKFDEVPEDWQPYFKAYREILDQLKTVREEIEITGEDIYDINPDLIIKSLTTDLVGEVGKKNLSPGEMRKQFEETLERDIKQFMKVYRELNQIEKDSHAANFKPEELPEKLRKEMLSNGEINDSGLVPLLDLLNSIEKFEENVRNVESRLEKISY